MMFRPSSTARHGFTLIEILVVVAIIGILMAAGFVAFTNARRGSRDARRQSDMRAMQNAFEQYYNANDDAYASDPNLMLNSFTAGAKPRDPQQGKNYTTTMTGINGTSASGYCICADVEQTSKGNSASDTCAFTTNNSGDFFCVTTQQ
jgi:prepilin-type N-terminal cleavage/methylation domain-containing protein